MFCKKVEGFYLSFSVFSTETLGMNNFCLLGSGTFFYGSITLQGLVLATKNAGY